jgi:hypothetical protein
MFFYFILFLLLIDYVYCRIVSGISSIIDDMSQAYGNERTYYYYVVPYLLSENWFTNVGFSLIMNLAV